MFIRLFGIWRRLLHFGEVRGLETLAQRNSGDEGWRLIDVRWEICCRVDLKRSVRELATVGGGLMDESEIGIVG